MRRTTTNTDVVCHVSTEKIGLAMDIPEKANQYAVPPALGSTKNNRATNMPYLRHLSILLLAFEWFGACHQDPRRCLGLK